MTIKCKSSLYNRASQSTSEVLDLTTKVRFLFQSVGVVNNFVKGLQFFALVQDNLDGIHEQSCDVRAIPTMQQLLKAAQLNTGRKKIRYVPHRLRLFFRFDAPYSSFLLLRFFGLHSQSAPLAIFVCLLGYVAPVKGLKEGTFGSKARHLAALKKFKAFARSKSDLDPGRAF